MTNINPKIVKLLKESDKNLVGTALTVENCASVLQSMALQHLSSKF